ncbi:hypothetical protein AB0910_16840 [Streptomyces sp. NPDC047002]|uniref:hypothetical protein n=1 Tax=Streptomyces sp. NPDC047002 TaxID=3155475 RepID=UPI003452F2AB
MSEPNPYANDGQGQGGWPGLWEAEHPWEPPGGREPTALAGGSTLVAIGDITVLNTGRIVTPSGTLPLHGAVWSAMDMSRTEERVPPYAIVLAAVFFVFCLLGLLFLLVKERTTTGFVQVTVVSAGRHHSTVVPVTHPATVPHVRGQLRYARSLSA